MSQIVVLWHIALKLFLKRGFSLFQIDTLPSGDKKKTLEIGGFSKGFTQIFGDLA